MSNFGRELGGGDGFSGWLLNPLYERLRGGDEGFGDVGRMLRQIYDDPRK